MSFAKELDAYLNAPEQQPSMTPLDRLSLSAPGLCLISAPYTLVRRRLLVALVMREIMRQVDNHPECLKTLHIFSNDGSHLLIKDLLVLDSGFDLSSFSLRSSAWDTSKPKSASDLQLLSIAAGLDGDSKDAESAPLSMISERQTFARLSSKISTCPARSAFFIENVHHIEGKAGSNLLEELMLLRNIAVERESVVYLGAGAIPDANLFPGRGDTHVGLAQRRNPASALPAPLLGVESFIDKLVYLEPADTAVVNVLSTSNTDLTVTFRL